MSPNLTLCYMYTCKICGEEFPTRHHLGGHALQHSKKDHGSVARHKEAVKEYNLHPKLCRTCGEPLPYEKRANTYCDHVCAAKYTNVQRGEPHFCAYCGKQLKGKHKSRYNKYCDKECERNHRDAQIIKEWKETGVGNEQKGVCKVIREYILQKQEGRCDVCHIEPHWNGKPLVFILDHIDGNYMNNLESNLHLVCSNCDSQLDTYKSKNKLGRFKRRQRYREGKSY